MYLIVTEGYTCSIGSRIPYQIPIHDSDPEVSLKKLQERERLDRRELATVLSIIREFVVAFNGLVPRYSFTSAV